MAANLNVVAEHPGETHMPLDDVQVGRILQKLDDISVRLDDMGQRFVAVDLYNMAHSQIKDQISGFDKKVTKLENEIDQKEHERDQLKRGMYAVAVTAAVSLLSGLGAALAVVTQ